MPCTECLINILSLLLYYLFLFWSGSHPAHTFIPQIRTKCPYERHWLGWELQRRTMSLPSKIEGSGRGDRGVKSCHGGCEVLWQKRARQDVETLRDSFTCSKCLLWGDSGWGWGYRRGAIREGFLECSRPLSGGQSGAGQAMMHLGSLPITGGCWFHICRWGSHNGDRLKNTCLP